MPERDGLELLAELRRRKIMTPVVVITAYGDIPHAVRAMQLGAIDFLEKPLTPEALRVLVKEILARHQAGEALAGPPLVQDDFTSQLGEAKRLLNLQKFAPAWAHLARALELNPRSPEALNLGGVYFEMHEDFDRARKLYGKAIKYGPHDPAPQQNMRRLFDLFHFGSSEESVSLGGDL
jgi:YesN/AraC family two-component response regulator